MKEMSELELRSRAVAPVLMAGLAATWFMSSDADLSIAVRIVSDETVAFYVVVAGLTALGSIAHAASSMELNRNLRKAARAAKAAHRRAAIRGSHLCIHMMIAFVTLGTARYAAQAFG